MLRQLAIQQHDLVFDLDPGLDNIELFDPQGHVCGRVDPDVFVGGRDETQRGGQIACRFTSYGDRRAPLQLAVWDANTFPSIGWQEGLGYRFRPWLAARF